MSYNGMMTSSNGNIFRVTGHLCGEFIGPRWIPRTKASDAELWCLICAWINGWVNNGEAGDLRRYRTHDDVIVMVHIVSITKIAITTLHDFLITEQLRWKSLNILTCKYKYSQVSGYILGHSNIGEYGSILAVDTYIHLALGPIPPQ